MKLVTDKERNKIWNEVDEWFKKEGFDIFANSKMTAKIAVAEYLANKQNLTLFVAKLGERKNNEQS